MSHLSRSDLLEALERRDATSHHLATCSRCRRELASLRRILREVQDVEVPEPSPLFWEHFPGRVSAAVEVDRVPAAAMGFTWRSWWGATAAAAVTGMAIAGLLVGGRQLSVGPTSSPSPNLAAESESVMADDTPWMLVEALAEELNLDEVELAGVVIAAGTAERAAAQLTVAEHVELVRLLRGEIDQ